MRTNSVFLAASDTVSPPCTSSQTAVKSRIIRSMIGEQSGNLNTSRYFNKIPEHKVTDLDSTSANARTYARIQHCLRETVTMATSEEQEGKWPLWFGREATRTWRKSTTSKDFFDNFGREFSLPTNWFGKLETSWIHFCKKIAATYKLLISPTFRPIFQIGPRTNALVL